MLKTDRGFWKCFFLTIITLGIYGLFYIYRLAKDTNLTCEPDNKKSGGLAFYILMSIITFGLYNFYWHYKVCDRMAGLLMKCNKEPEITGGGWLLWSIFGSLIIIGPFVALYKEIHLWNDANEIYNNYNGSAS